MIPNNPIELDQEQTLQVIRVIEDLEDLDDVQEVYSNLNLSEEMIAVLENE
jgi:transcriptional/translational regulatory protein YebC/TACO1